MYFLLKGKVDTVIKAFKYAVGKFGDRDCIGTREVLGEEDETQSSGKVKIFNFFFAWD